MAEKQVRKVDELVNFHLNLGSRSRVWSRNLQKETGRVKKTAGSIARKSSEKIRRKETSRKADEWKNWKIKIGLWTILKGKVASRKRDANSYRKLKKRTLR